jgi:hypothetical protein
VCDVLVNVAEALTDDRERHGVFEQDRSMRVAQRMQREVRIVGLAQQCLGPRADVIGRVGIPLDWQKIRLSTR